MWFKSVDIGAAIKAHYVSGELSSEFIEDLGQRYPKFELSPELSKPLEEVAYEPGGYGMRAMDQPQVTFEVKSGKLRTDLIKVEELLSDLKLAQKKTFASGTPYYKLYSRFCCLVLTPEERISLIEQLESRIGGLEEQAEKETNRQEEALNRMAEEGYLYRPKKTETPKN